MFAKFMNKKFFHPGSYPNEKKKWVREKKVAANEKSEKETQAMYQKEQESYQSRMLSAKSAEEKMKLDLNFLYDLPPGMRNKNDDDFDDEEGDKKEKEVKFEWQKHAPRSKYIQELGLDCQDQPFGVCVRNIRCFTCKAWGHQNTDRECPMFFSNVSAEANAAESTSSVKKQTLRLSDPLLLVNVMKEQHGLTLKKSVIGKEIDPMAEMAENQKMLASDDDDDEELGDADLKFVESLSNKQKRRLLKHLNKMEKKERKRDERKRKEMNTDSRSSGCSSEDDVSDHEYNLHRKRKRRTSIRDNSGESCKDYKKHRPSSHKCDSESYTHRKRRNSSRTENISVETDYHKRKKSRNRRNERN